MKYRVKLLLWKGDPNPQGLFPVYIRTAIDGKRSYISTGIFIQEKHWDKKTEQVKDGNPMHHVYNPDLTERKAKIIRSIVEKQMAGKVTTAAQVKETFTGGRDLHNIFDFIEEYTKNMQHKREGATIENYRKFARKLDLFHKSKILAFEEVDGAFLQRFEDSLRAEGLGDNYIWANFKMFKTFFNAARKRKVIDCYPFDQYESPQYEAAEKDHLTLTELRKLDRYAAKVKNPVDKQTAIYFLLGCCTGLRISDWYQFDLEKHVQGDSIRLRATKNGEWVTMPITKWLRRTLARVAKTPLTADEPVINRTLKDIAIALGINKHLTTHCARHSFAITICAEQGIGVEVAAELMGITVATCVNNYYKTTKTKIDAECRKAWRGL